MSCVTLVHLWTMDGRAVPSAHHNYTTLSFLFVSTFSDYYTIIIQLD